MPSPKIKIFSVLKAYKNTDAKGKALLEEACGIEIFTGNVMDRVTSLQAACEELGWDYNVEFSDERTRHETPDETGYRELKIIFEALNEGEEIDYSNPNQYKYYGVVKPSSGRGLSLYVVYFDGTRTLVGPRLCTLSEEKYRFAFKQFPDSFKKFFLNHKK